MSSPNLSDSARRTAHDVRNQAEDLKSTAQQNAGAVMHSAQQFGADVKHAVQDQLGNLQDTASEYMEQGKSVACDMRHSLEDRIRQQPLNSMLVVAGIGFALGFLFTRR
ncbi:MAG TPA: DUF883 C-terminal domain-containing protein [Pirellulales bacterium]|jgi:ElaB/YqjD/DUF883 family membrane-anchored ribosome-binding protein|nr:DUF883 C-terminal domain-containing protein [Pirellulales bacterium]